MLWDFAVLLAAAGLIYISCELFVNGIEWIGKKFNISQNAVGSVLAALGTALPESSVTLMAVAFGVQDIGVGAALGGPLILSTVGYAVVGWCLFIYLKQQARATCLSIDSDKLARNQVWFLVIFTFNIALGLIAFPGKAYSGLLLIAAYAWYAVREMQAESSVAKNLAPLTFRPHEKDPSVYWVLLQTGLALILIFLGSQTFVHRLEGFSLTLGLPAHIVALFLSPVATELPETINAVIWVRQGKIALALSNISGSMMIQAAIPSALGLLFTSWRFDQYLVMAGAVTWLSIFFLWLTLRRQHLCVSRLLFCGFFYLLFVAGTYASAVHLVDYQSLSERVLRFFA